MERLISILFIPIYIIVYSLYFLFSVLNIFLLWSWMRPVTSTFLLIALFNFSFLYVITFLVVFFGDIFINLILVNIHDYFVLKRTFETYFRDFSQCFFEPVKLETNVKNEIFTGLILKAMSFVLQINPYARAFYIWDPQPENPIPLAYNTRQFVGGKSWVFLPKKPNEMKGISRFLLYHELGHSSISHFFYVTQSYFATIYFFILILLLHFESGNNDLTLYLSLGLLILWATYILFRKPLKGEIRETFADLYALILLAGEDNYSSMVKRVSAHYEKIGEKSSKEILLSSAKTIENAIKDKEKMDLISPIVKLIRKTQPTSLVTVPIAVVVIYIASLVKSITWETTGLIFVLYVLVPALIYNFYVIKKIVKVKISALDFIHKRQTPNKEITFDDVF